MVFVGVTVVVVFILVGPNNVNFKVWSNQVRHSFDLVVTTPKFNNNSMSIEVKKKFSTISLTYRYGKSGKSSARRFAFSNLRLGEIPNLSHFSGFFQ